MNKKFLIRILGILFSVNVYFVNHLINDIDLSTQINNQQNIEIALLKGEIKNIKEQIRILYLKGKKK